MILPLFVLAAAISSGAASIALEAFPSDFLLTLNQTAVVTFTASSQLPDDVVLKFNKSLELDLPDSIIVHNETGKGDLTLRALMLTSKAVVEIAGCEYAHNNDTCQLDLSDAYIRVTVIKWMFVDYLVDIVGWCYFFAWSISFYPQIVLNIQRKSVVGLNFDFLLLNIIGFTAYTLYNCFMYFSSAVQEEYLALHPRSPIPVLLNDVVFAVHALFACLITAAQCFFYEKGEQRLSRGWFTFGGVLVSVGIFSGALSVLHIINALNFITLLSYLKMAVTLSKYFPQAFYNFERKSTVGWSIGNVLLDFTGGLLDIVQMILQAVNASDWSAFYGNPVKFGLGLVSIIFDVLFMIQHYILYRETDNAYAGVTESSPQVPHEFGSRGSQVAIISED